VRVRLEYVDRFAFSMTRGMSCHRNAIGRTAGRECSARQRSLGRPPQLLNAKARPTAESSGKPLGSTIAWINPITLLPVATQLGVGAHMIGKWRTRFIADRCAN
jgi:hypothetical protein